MIPYLRTIMAGLILALAAGLWFSIERAGGLSARAETAEKALSAAEAQRKKDAQLLTARQAEIVSERRKSARSSAALSEALRANESWAATHVPPEVQSTLSEALEGLE